MLWLVLGVISQEVRLLPIIKIISWIHLKNEITENMMHCNILTGEGIHNFWKVLLEGRNCAVPIPKERFDVSQWYDADENKAGKSRTAKAALIDGYVRYEHTPLAWIPIG